MAIQFYFLWLELRLEPFFLPSLAPFALHITQISSDQAQLWKPQEFLEPEAEESSSETSEDEGSEDDMDESEDKAEDKEKPVEKPVKKQQQKEKAAKKIVKKMGDKGKYDSANQTKTLIVMQVLGNTKTFFETQQALSDRAGFFTDITLPDTTI